MNSSNINYTLSMDSHFSCKITLSMGNVTLISWIQLDSNSITNTVVPVVGLLSLKTHETFTPFILRYAESLYYCL